MVRDFASGKISGELIQRASDREAARMISSRAGSWNAPSALPEDSAPLRLALDKRIAGASPTHPGAPLGGL